MSKLIGYTEPRLGSIEHTRWSFCNRRLAKDGYAEDSARLALMEEGRRRVRRVAERLHNPATIRWDNAACGVKVAVEEGPGQIRFTETYLVFTSTRGQEIAAPVLVVDLMAIGATYPGSDALLLEIEQDIRTALTEVG